MRTVQFFGLPSIEEIQQVNVDAIVIALKSRSVDPQDAVAQSLEAYALLKAAGTQRTYFKYCSTFDSTDQGNIGPVAEALLQESDVPQTIFCPAFPHNGRTVYQGHLFVNGKLLNQSGMENHPINPMTDSNLQSVLGRQSSSKIGLLDYIAISSGRVAEQMESLNADGNRFVITDTCSDDDLKVIAKAVASMKLLTGGSGLARFLPAAWEGAGFCEKRETSFELAKLPGRQAILSGSCSSATQRQVEFFESKCHTVSLDIQQLVDDEGEERSRIAQQMEQGNPNLPILIYSTSSPDRVQEIQSRFGVAEVAGKIESLMGDVAKQLVEKHNVSKLVVAGGETSGAVTRSLGIKAIQIGPEVCPGVPWTLTIGETPMLLLLKSGNFGEDNFFETALEMVT